MEDIRKRQASEDHVRSVLWGRAAQKTSQLALIFAASRQTGLDAMSVDLPDVDLAIRINNWSTRKLVYHAEHSVAESEHQRRVQRILEAIPHDKWITKNQLTRRTCHIADRQLRERVIADVIEAGQIETKQELGRTRPAVLYRRKRK
jgi:hypothetical protein